MTSPKLSAFFSSSKLELVADLPFTLILAELSLKLQTDF